MMDTCLPLLDDALPAMKMVVYTPTHMYIDLSDAS